MVAVIKGRFAQNIDILRVSDITVYSRLSVDYVVLTSLRMKICSFDDRIVKSEKIFMVIWVLLLCHMLNLKSRVL